MSPRFSVVVPVYNEGAEIEVFLDRLFDSITLPCEVLAVYDTPDDSTVPHLEAYAARDARLVPTHNTYDRGAALAMKYGIHHVNSVVVVVTLAEPSISFIDNLAYDWIVNKDATDLTTAEDGTGPYTLDGWTRGSNLALERSDGY